MTDTLVVTFPTGKICSPLLPLINSEAKFKLRLAAQSQASFDKLIARYPDADVVRTDLNDLTSCRNLLRDATSVFHVGPCFHSPTKGIGFNLVDAAIAESQREGNVFKHFVFCSVLGTQHRNPEQHGLQSHIEDRIFLSSLNWTILKPTNFMESYPVVMLAGREKPILEKHWNAEISNSLIALRDLAEAAAKVLRERETHYLAEYSLCSTMPLSDVHVISAIGRRIGKEINLKPPSFAGSVTKVLAYLFGSMARGAGVSTEDVASVNSDRAKSELTREGYMQDDVTPNESDRLILFYSRRSLRGSPNVLKWLLGREPTTLEDCIDLQLKDTDLTFKGPERRMSEESCRSRASKHSDGLAKDKIKHEV